MARCVSVPRVALVLWGVACASSFTPVHGRTFLEHGFLPVETCLWVCPSSGVRPPTKAQSARAMAVGWSAADALEVGAGGTR